MFCSLSIEFDTEINDRRDSPRWPRDNPLSENVGTKFRQQVAVPQSV
jgi:hypothetical protein